MEASPSDFPGERVPGGDSDAAETTEEVELARKTGLCSACLGKAARHALHSKHGREKLKMKSQEEGRKRCSKEEDRQTDRQTDR